VTFSGAASFDGSGDLIAGTATLDPDPIFAAGFESGDVSVWAIASTGGGDLTVAGAPAGSFGLSVFVNDMQVILLAPGSPPAPNLSYDGSARLTGGRSRMLSLLLLTLALQTPAAQATPPPEPRRLELAPGARYDVRIPTLRQVVGHDVGARISSPDDIATDLEALAAAARDRMRRGEYARAWEGRPLHVAIIGAPIGSQSSIRSRPI
jgi:hypothetical protein